MVAKPVKYNTGLKYNSGVVYNGTVADNQNPVMANSTDTPIIVTLTATQKAAILAKIAELAALFTCTPSASRMTSGATLPKLGDKTAGWDEKDCQLHGQPPGIGSLLRGHGRADPKPGAGRTWATSSGRWPTSPKRLDDTDMKVGSQSL